MIVYAMDARPLPHLPCNSSTSTAYDGRCSGARQSRFPPFTTDYLKVGWRKLMRSDCSKGKLCESINAEQKRKNLHVVRCNGDEAIGGPIPVPKYNTYIDPLSGEPAPPLGNRPNLRDAAFAGKDMSRIRRMSQASVPEKVDKNTKPRRRKRAPGSGRRKASDDSGNISGTASTSSDISRNRNATKAPQETVAQVEPHEDDEDEDEDEFRDEYVTYAPEEQEKEIDDIAYGAPHALLQEKQGEEHALVLAEKPLSDDELWWNWRKFPPGKEPWSAWHKRPGNSDSVMAAAMAEIGQIKLFGEKPTYAEATLARARKFVFYKERLEMEEKRKNDIGPMAYYQEWVKAWKKDTSKEAVQKHFEETGEDVSVQLLNMFEHQTQEEYRYMMGTDIRIRRDPLTMRMRDEQKMQVWGGDPVYPTINYVQDPDSIADYRGPNFHEPIPDILDGLRKEGRLVTKEEIRRIQQAEKAALQDSDIINDAMVEAIDIGEKEDGEEADESSHPWRTLRSVTSNNGGKKVRRNIDRENKSA